MPLKPRTLLTALLSSLLMYGTAAAEDKPAAPTPKQDAALLERKAGLETRILTLEQQRSAWGQELGKAYYELGLVLQTMEEHQQATDALAKSLLSYRSSYGLKDLQQLPVLRALLVSNRSLGKWEALDSNHYLLYQIASLGQDSGPELRGDALLQLGRWRVEAAKNDLLPEHEQSTFLAIDLYRKEIRRLTAENRGPSLHLATLYLELAKAETILADTATDTMLMGYDSKGQSPYTQEQQCETIRLADGRTMRNCYTVDVPNLNYFLAKNSSKSELVGTHLFAARDALISAQSTLKQYQQVTPQSLQLLREMETAITDYNADNRKNETTLDSRIRKKAPPDSSRRTD